MTYDSTNIDLSFLSVLGRKLNSKVKMPRGLTLKVYKKIFDDWINYYLPHLVFELKEVSK